MILSSISADYHMEYNRFATDQYPDIYHPYRSQKSNDPAYHTYDPPKSNYPYNSAPKQPSFDHRPWLNPQFNKPPPDVIRVTKTVAIRVPYPKFIYVPHNVPYPVPYPVSKPFPVEVTKIVDLQNEPIPPSVAPNALDESQTILQPPVNQESVSNPNNYGDWANANSYGGQTHVSNYGDWSDTLKPDQQWQPTQ